jgi:hypothetical protein
MVFRGILSATTLRASMNRMAMSDQAHVFVYSSQTAAVAVTVLAALVEISRCLGDRWQHCLAPEASVDDILHVP